MAEEGAWSTLQDVVNAVRCAVGIRRAPRLRWISGLGVTDGSPSTGLHSELWTISLFSGMLVMLVKVRRASSQLQGQAVAGVSQLHACVVLQRLAFTAASAAML